MIEARGRAVDAPKSRIVNLCGFTVGLRSGCAPKRRRGAAQRAASVFRETDFELQSSQLILEILVKQVNTDAKRDLDTSPRCSKRRQRTRDDGGVVLMPGMKMVHVSCESDLR